MNESIEKRLNEENISISDLKKEPEICNELLDSLCKTLIIALLNTKSSGIFIILDSTINPSLPSSDSSKAGLYICNMEPNMTELETPSFHMLRGPLNIAKNNIILIHPHWKMEFDINKESFFTKTMETVRNNAEKPLSRLYYWYTDNSLYNNDNKVMLCIAPLIATDGTIYGVCGFEVSLLLFKLSYIPDIPISDAVFTMLSKVENNAFNLNLSFISAKYPSLITGKFSDTMTSCQKKPKSLVKYLCNSGQFIGLHEKIALYADDSPYKDEEWVVSVMSPADDYERVVSNINRRVFFFLLVLLLISIEGSFWSSKFYLKPITETINKMKQIKPSEIEKTNIVEIDDLLEFLSKQDRDKETKAQKNNPPVADIQNINMFKEFLNNIRTLSPAERAVFDLYMEGYTAKEIAEKLYLSINTIKTHNKRIYEKMNVSSRNELMVYFKMMKEINLNEQEH
ncbi:MAG: helix-turn-helix transcriptional regulator [Clostridiaceae bacterium]|nr:helix-turn-helix transcriptional regulator [Clostridiaceae bacterium]